MTKVLHDVFLGTGYLLGTLGFLAVSLFLAAVIRELIRYLRGKK